MINRESAEGTTAVADDHTTTPQTVRLPKRGLHHNWTLDTGCIVIRAMIIMPGVCFGVDMSLCSELACGEARGTKTK